MRVLPLASTGTVVSSAWMRSAAKTCAADRLDQRHQRRRRRRRPSRPASRRRARCLRARRPSLWRLSGRCRPYLANRTCASRPGPARPRAIGCDGAGGCVIALAGPAGELLAHVLDHLPLARDELQRLGHVLADLAQGRPAAARAGRRQRIDDALARQMLGQRPARRLAPLERRHIDCCARRGCRDPCRRLGLPRHLLPSSASCSSSCSSSAPRSDGLAEPLVPQLGDRELELLDQHRAVLRFALRRQPCGALGHEHRLQRRDIVGQRIVNAHRRRENHRTICVSDPTIRASIHNAAISRPPAAARCAAAAASRCLRADSPAAPA